MRSGSVASYELIADFYDEDMGANVGSGDVAFYVEQCAASEGPVLELGCGTGRVTLPLVLSGRAVAGIDASQAMLARLRQKANDSLTAEQRRRLWLAEMDMAALSFRRPFACIVCPYSAFTYVVEPERRSSALGAVRELLAPGGRFILDVFVPDPRFNGSTSEQVFFDYDRARADGTRLVRTKTVAADIAPGVNRITRDYRFLDTGGEELRRVRTCEAIRYYYPDQLEEVLKEAGFEVLRTLFDFEDGREQREAKMVACVARRR